MPIASSVFRKAAATSSRSDCGNCRPSAKKTVQNSVLMVKPAGTGRPSLAISARLAPLPPSVFFIVASPSVPCGPKK